ncbi:MAG: hypothetical protein JWM37_114 [Candidatus Saccharibacteria bacterium]|nr:hypothetical protein [Candidatus Saccharibacteria bacterium]
MAIQLRYQRPTKLSSLSIVLPAYNEADNIIRVIDEALAVAKLVTDTYEVLVVNDGSSDNTGRLVKDYAKRNAHVKLISNRRNLGYGRTIRKGLDAARYDWVFFTDADGQFELREITKLVPYTDSFDFIIGKRNNRKSALHRKIKSAIFNAAVRIFYGIKVKDVDCAFKLMRRAKLHALELISESAMVNTEILHRARVAGMTIKQVSVTHKPRIGGASSRGNRDLLKRAVKEFYTLRWTLLQTEAARIKFNTRVVLLGSLLAAIVATIWAYHNNVILAYGDAEAHLNIAKRITGSLTPGAAQLGGIWLPLPHLLMAPFVVWDPLWRSGIGGSVVSIVAFVFLCMTLYRFAYQLTKSFVASYIAPLVVMLNPNSMYLATTPMTEILLLSMFTASVYYFTKWLRGQKLLHLVLASVFTALATLSRYDGWALVCIEACCLAVYLVLKRHPFKVVEGTVFLYSFVAFMGIVLWLLWNKTIFNSFLYFSNSVYGSKEQQLFFLNNGYLPTYHNIVKSVVYFLEDIRLVVGLPVILIALLGVGVFVRKAMVRKQYKYLLLIPLTLTPVFFYVLSLYAGQASLILPTFAAEGAKFTISNTRYGLQILLFIAIFAAFLGARYKKTIPLIIAIIGVQSFAFIRSDTVITYLDGTRGLSSQAVSKGSDAPKVEAYIRAHYDGGLLLMDDYRRPIGPVESGVPMQAFIGSGNKPYWTESFNNPGKYADWIVLQQSDTDAIWRNLERKDLLNEQFVNVYREGYLYVYKKKPTNPDFVRQSGQHLTLNGKPYVFSGVNSYDILTQPKSEIDNRIKVLKDSGLNTIRLWCFDKNGTLTSDELGKLDYLIYRAGQNNIKLICVFGNTYNDYGGPANFEAENNNSFFTSQVSRGAYKKYINYVMEHRSPYNGLTIKQQGAVAAWELINEPRIEGQPNSTMLMTWTEDIAQYVASKDQEHLISPGTEGFTESYPGQAYNEQHGSSVERLCTLEVITLCSGHMYPKYLSPQAEGNTDYSKVGNTLHVWRSLADKYHKPFYVGEVGFDLALGNESARQQFFANVHSSAIANTMDGALLWNLGAVPDNHYTLSPQDTASSGVIRNWAYRANAQ